MDFNQTLLLVKPDAVGKHHIGEILGRLETAGFAVTGLVMRRLSREEAEEFYAIHRGKEFFAGLVEFMTSGPLVAVRLDGPDVCRRVRAFVGLTDPSKAAPGTIRADFGTSVRTNAVHASNPDEDVRREVAFFFP
ncbi:MAG TPA: nucleoside-diphosphate kinase [bacterium]|nr:nucleoside-diphosphate kinase [bacterium]